jgi:hypothetical protein
MPTGTIVSPETVSRVQRLRRAMKADESKLKVWRDLRVKFLEQYVGPNYAGGNIKSIPLNTLGGAVLSLIPHIVSANPKAGLTAKGEASEAMATLMGNQIDRWAADQGLKDSLQASATDAMFGMAALWCGLAPGGKKEQGEIEDYLEDSGVVAVDTISLDDFGFDTRAKRFSECAYQWHEIEAPLEWAKGFYPNAENLRGGEQEWQEPTAKGRTLSGKGTEGSQDRAVDTVRLRIVWLPRGWSGYDAPLLLTLAPEGQGDMPLAEVPYEGPKRGPYEIVSYHEVPDNIYPLPPSAIWFDLHTLLNKVARKMGLRLGREKDILLVEETGKADGENIKAADDGDILAVKNVDRHQQVTFGGVKPETLTTVTWLSGLFSKLSGNLDLVSGSSAGAPTLGQTQVLMQNVAGRVEFMRGALAKAAQRVYEKVAWYMLHDPTTLPAVPWTVSDEDLMAQFDGMPDALKDEVLTQWRQSDGTSPLMIALTPEMRADLTLEDFQIEVEPYSLTPDSPEQAGQKIIGFVQNVYAPLSEQLTAQGTTLDVADLLERAAKMMNIRDIKFKPQAPPAPIGPMGGTQAGPASVSISAPGAGPAPAAAQTPQPAMAGAGGR